MNEFNFGSVLLSVFLGSLFCFFIFKKYVLNIFDPLFNYSIVLAFSIAMMLLVVDDFFLGFRLFVYICFFCLGFRLFACSKEAVVSVNLRTSSLLKVSMIVGFLFLFFMNVLVWVKSGVPLFSDDPSVQKSAAFNDGLGISRRLNWGLGIYLIVGSVFFVVSVKSVFWKFFSLVLMLVMMVSGGKSVLLPFVFSVGLFMAKPFSYNESIINTLTLKRYGTLFLLCAMVIALIVFSIESDSVISILENFFTRLLYNGDIMLYWISPHARSIFIHYNAIDYFLHISNGISGFFRLTAYELPIGNVIVLDSLPPGVELNGVVGPNAPFYVKGEIFFGFFFAVMYSFFIGSIFSCSRNLFLKYSGSNSFFYVFFISILIVSTGISIEDSLIVNQLFDLTLALFFVLCFSYLYILAVKKDAKK